MCQLACWNHLVWDDAGVPGIQVRNGIRADKVVALACPLGFVFYAGGDFNYVPKAEEALQFDPL
eukprot:4699185-Karenia_brevis.AAC.1